MVKRATQERERDQDEPEAEAGAGSEVVPDWTVISGLSRSNLAEIVEEHDVIARRMKVDKARLDDLKQMGVKLLVKAGVKSVMCNGLRVTKIDGSSSRLNKQKLFKLGGERVMRWIAQATEKTNYTSLKVTAKDEAEE